MLLQKKGIQANIDLLKSQHETELFSFNINVRRLEREAAFAAESIQIAIETERAKAEILAKEIEDPRQRAAEIKRINAQADIDKEAAASISNQQIQLDSEKHVNELFVINLGYNEKLKGLEDERTARKRKIRRKKEKDEEDANAKSIRDNIKMFNTIVNNTKSALDKINDIKNKEANEEIRLAEESVRKQQEIAAAGGNAIIGQEKARLAKLRVERKRELERQARQERNIALAQNFVNSLAAHSKEDPATAFAKAAFETFAGGQFAKLIAGFAEGGYTGDGDKYEAAGLVHKGEFVVDKETTSRLGLRNASMSDFNDRFTGISQDLSPSQYKQLEVSSMIQQPNNVNLMPMITEISKQTSRLEKAFEKGQATYEVHWNEHGEATETRKKGGVGNSLLFKKSQL